MYGDKMPSSPSIITIMLQPSVSGTSKRGARNSHIHNCFSPGFSWVLQQQCRDGFHPHFASLYLVYRLCRFFRPELVIGVVVVDVKPRELSVVDVPHVNWLELECLAAVYGRFACQDGTMLIIRHNVEDLKS